MSRDEKRQATVRIDGRKVVRSCAVGELDVYAVRKWGRLYWTADLGTSWHQSKREAVRS